MAKDDDVLSAAMIETEMEIAGSAWGKEETVLDETGDKSLETLGDGLEGQHEPDDDEDETESEEEGESEEESGEDETAAAKAKAEDGKDKEVDDGKSHKGEPEAHVPSVRLREQTERARKLEAERDELRKQLDTQKTEAQKAYDALNAKVEGVLAAIQRGREPKPDQSEPKADTVPDIFEDPKGFVDHLTKGFQTELAQRDRRLEEMRVETSMAIAHSKHADVFSKAFEAIGKLDPRNPDDQQTVRRIYASANPGEALVSWHRRNETLREVGDDPAAYKQRVVDEARQALMSDPEFRQQLVESMKAEAMGADGKPVRTLTRLPKSLNGARGGSSPHTLDPSQLDDSDQAIADSAWR